MLIRGAWHVCDDGFIRPVIRGEVLAGDGTWVQVVFLADIGADRTVFSADVFQALHLKPIGSAQQLGGVGGVTRSVAVSSEIVFFRETGARVTFRGEFAALTDTSALDMSVLGRDISNLFAVIVDRPGNLVCLVGPGHHYTIDAKPAISP